MRKCFAMGKMFQAEIFKVIKLHGMGEEGKAHLHGARTRDFGIRLPHLIVAQLPAYLGAKSLHQAARWYGCRQT